MNANSRGIYETKKKILGLGNGATVTQIGDGKDIISLLCACNTDIRDHIFRINNLMRTLTVRANAEASEDDRMSEEEIIGQIMYAFS